MTAADYVGRFAPSPTGQLHFGSLLAAMASYCDARSVQGLWQVRIDDIDPPRAMPDAVEHFSRTLENYGFYWDGPLIQQSMHTKFYLSKLDQLNQQSQLFICQCSRADLAGLTLYPGHCRDKGTDRAAVEHRLARPDITSSDTKTAVRVIVSNNVSFTDLIQGPQHFQTTSDIGDTIVFRKDDFFSYALACAVDDANGISRVVRGADLLSTTAVQLAIINLLGLTAPEYAHIPVVLNSDKQKLSKQTHAQAIDAMPVLPTLLHAWHLLGQHAIDVSSVDAFWRVAFENWELSRVPKLSQLHETL